MYYLRQYTDSMQSNGEKIVSSTNSAGAIRPKTKNQKKKNGVLIVAQRKPIPLGTMRLQV